MPKAKMPETYDCLTEPGRTAGLAAAAEALAAGELVVFATDTVYGVAADPKVPGSVTRLLAAKGRDETMPPPVLIADLESARGLVAELPQSAEKLIEAFWPGALTIVCQAEPQLPWHLGETNGTVAIRQPNHPFALELLCETGPLAVSSANRHGAMAALGVAEAAQMLGDSIAVYLDAGPATGGAASTIVDVTESNQGKVRVLRHGAIPARAISELLPDLVVTG